MDNVFTQADLWKVQGKSHNEQLFMDLQWAYNSIHHERMLIASREFQIPAKLIRVYIDGSRAIIRAREVYLHSLSIRTGLGNFINGCLISFSRKSSEKTRNAGLKIKHGLIWKVEDSKF